MLSLLKNPGGPDSQGHKFRTPIAWSNIPLGNKNNSMITTMHLMAHQIGDETKINLKPKERENPKKEPSNFRMQNC